MDFDKVTLEKDNNINKTPPLKRGFLFYRTCTTLRFVDKTPLFEITPSM